MWFLQRAKPHLIIDHRSKEKGDELAPFPTLESDDEQSDDDVSGSDFFSGSGCRENNHYYMGCCTDVILEENTDVAKKHQQECNAKQVKEMNFDSDITPLYDSIQAKQWSETEKVASADPRQAAIWIYRTEVDEDAKLRWRLLPIHAALIFKCPKSTMKALVDAFPEGCSMKDDQDNLPLHLAAKNHKVYDNDALHILLEAYPEGVNMKNTSGMIPNDFLQGSSRGLIGSPASVGTATNHVIESLDMLKPSDSSVEELLQASILFAEDSFSDDELAPIQEESESCNEEMMLLTQEDNHERAPEVSVTNDFDTSTSSKSDTTGTETFSSTGEASPKETAHDEHGQTTSDEANRGDTSLVVRSVAFKAKKSSSSHQLMWSLQEQQEIAPSESASAFLCRIDRWEARLNDDTAATIRSEGHDLGNEDANSLSDNMNQWLSLCDDLDESQAHEAHELNPEEVTEHHVGRQRPRKSGIQVDVDELMYSSNDLDETNEHLQGHEKKDADEQQYINNPRENDLKRASSGRSWMNNRVGNAEKSCDNLDSGGRLVRSCTFSDDTDTTSGLLLSPPKQNKHYDLRAITSGQDTVQRGVGIIALIGKNASNSGMRNEEVVGNNCSIRDYNNEDWSQWRSFADETDASLLTDDNEYGDESAIDNSCCELHADNETIFTDCHEAHDERDMAVGMQQRAEATAEVNSNESDCQHGAKMKREKEHVDEDENPWLLYHSSLDDDQIDPPMEERIIHESKQKVWW